MSDDKDFIPVFTEEDLFPDAESSDDAVIVSAAELMEMEVDNNDSPTPAPEPTITDPTPEPESQDASNDVYKAVYNTLLDDGFFYDENPDEFEPSAENLKEKLKDIAEYEKAKIYHNSPDILKPIIEYALSAENTLDKKGLQEFVNTYIQEIEAPENYSEIDSIEEARSFLTTRMKGTLDPDALEAALDVLEDKQDNGQALLDKANSLKKQDFESTKGKYQEKIQSKVREEQAIKEKEQAFISQVVDELDNTGWDKRRVNRLKRELAGNVTNNTLQTALSSPKALIQLANLCTYFDSKTGSFNFEAFIKQSASKEVEELKNNQKQDYFSSISTKSSSVKGKMNLDKFLENDNFKPILE